MNICCLLTILSIFFANVGISSTRKPFGAAFKGIFGKVLDVLDPVQAACSTVGKLMLNKQFDEKKVHFSLWTKDNKGDEDSYDLIPYSDESLGASKFDGELPTYLFFHGFTEDDTAGKSKWILDSKNNIFNLHDANVFTIRYEELVMTDIFFMVDYVPAVCNSYKVAAYVAKVLNWLNEKAGLKATRIHLIGGSLGAQVAGITGQSMLGLPAGKVGRITGLDPAGPGFSPLFRRNKFRIDKSQADFVDIIHTNGCDNLAKCFGLKDKLGHVDFYPNGGVTQNGCTGEHSDCSHERSEFLFAESILPSEKKFQSWPCKSWSEYKEGKCKDCGEGQECPIMGFHAPPSARGVQYLSTNAESPFAKGEEQM